MKLALQYFGLLAATAIPLFALPAKDQRCGDLQKRLVKIAHRANNFRNDNCTTEDCLAIYKEAQVFAIQIDELGCNKPEVNAATQIERRKEQPELPSKCDNLHSQLIILNQMLATDLTAPSDADDRSDTNKCVGVHESFPEIDIWSNRCASSVPEIGKETVKLATSLQRVGCVWNSTCGPRCFQIGNNMFDAVRKMGPMQCNRFDSPEGPPLGLSQALHARNENATACAFLVEEVTEAKDQAIDCNSDSYFLKHHHECKDLPGKLKDLNEEVNAMNCSLNGTPRSRSLSPSGSLESSATMFASPPPNLHEESCGALLNQSVAVDQFIVYYISNDLDIPSYIGDWRMITYRLLYKIHCVYSTNDTSRLANRIDHPVGCDDVRSAVTDLDHLTASFFYDLDVIPEWLRDWQQFLDSLAESLSCNEPEIGRAERFVKRLDHSKVEESCESARKAADEVDLVMKDSTRKGRTAPRWTLSWLTSLNHTKANLGCDD